MEYKSYLSETVCAGIVYRRFFGRLEIIPPLLSGQLLRPDATGVLGAKYAKNAYAAGAPPGPLGELSLQLDLRGLLLREGKSKKMGR